MTCVGWWSTLKAQRSGFLHIFKKHFPYFFNTKWKISNTITYLNFSKISFMEHNAKIICRTVVSGYEQKLNKQVAEFGISILFHRDADLTYKWHSSSSGVLLFVIMALAPALELLVFMAQSSIRFHKLKF